MTDNNLNDKIYNLAESMGRVEGKIDNFIVGQARHDQEITNLKTDVSHVKISLVNHARHDGDISTLKTDVATIKTDLSGYKAYFKGVLAIFSLGWVGISLFLVPYLRAKFGL